MRVEERRLKTEADLNSANPSLFTELTFTGVERAHLQSNAGFGDVQRNAEDATQEQIQDQTHDRTKGQTQGRI